MRFSKPCGSGTCLIQETARIRKLPTLGNCVIQETARIRKLAVLESRILASFQELGRFRIPARPIVPKACTGSGQKNLSQSQKCVSPVRSSGPGPSRAWKTGPQDNFCDRLGATKPLVAVPRRFLGAGAPSCATFCKVRIEDVFGPFWQPLCRRVQLLEAVCRKSAIDSSAESPNHPTTSLWRGQAGPDQAAVTEAGNTAETVVRHRDKTRNSMLASCHSQVSCQGWVSDG